jgi:hypothetical protein
MLSFSESKKSVAIAHGYNTADCIGNPAFTVYYVPNYDKDAAPEIESSDPKTLIETERFRLMTEYGLSKLEFEHMVQRVAKNEPVDPSASRALKRAYLDIQLIINTKLKTTLEFGARENVFLKPVYDTRPDRTNQIVTMFGSSGAGKSYMINDLLMRNPAIKDGETVPAVYLFSSVGGDDPSYAPIREHMDEKFFWVDPKDMEAKDTLVSSYEKKSVLIFDDVASISNRRIRDRVLAFRDNCLEVARHKSLVIINSSHLFHDRVKTQKLRNSSSIFCLYPRNSNKAIVDVLETMFAMNRHERNDLVKKIKREGRCQFLRVDTPSFLINTKRVQLL